VKPAGVKNEKKAFVYTQTSWFSLSRCEDIRRFVEATDERAAERYFGAVAGAHPVAWALSQIENFIILQTC
jgi:hypothetical protein